MLQVRNRWPASPPCTHRRRGFKSPASYFLDPVVMANSLVWAQVFKSSEKVLSTSQNSPHPPPPRNLLARLPPFHPAPPCRRIIVR